MGLLEYLNKPNPKLAGLLSRLDAQNYGPNDSFIASMVNNPAGLLTTWLPKQVNTASGIADQYDNAKPWLAPSVDEQLGAAANLAGLAQVGSMPLAPKSAGGTVGTFIGPKAATWNKEAAEKAVQALDAGIDPAQVWKQHMIGRMPDGSLFSEIDDSAFKFTPQKIDSWGIGAGADQSLKARLKEAAELEKEGIPANKIFKLTDMIKRGDSWEDMRPPDVISQAAIHPEVAKNYQSDNLLFRSMDSLPEMGFNGNYDPGFNTALKSNGLSGRIDYTQQAKDPRSVALHELQHAIQQREGWASGGNPEQFKNEYDMNKSIAEYHRNKFHELKDSIKQLPEYQALSSARDAAINAGDKDAVVNYSNQISDLINNTGANNHYDIWKRTESQIIDPMEAYRRLTGEAQARATQDRINMNMDERRANYPLARGLLSDVPIEQLIYRYGDNGPAMAIDVWHGSPHKFDAFDMSKIGTGEGAQAYGHGLYFAENPVVAEEYSKNMPILKASDGQELPFNNNSETPEGYVHSLLSAYDGDYSQIKHEISTWGNKYSGNNNEFNSQLLELLNKYERLGVKPEQGNLYKTSLEWPDPAREAADPLGPQHFLDWDKPLSEQPESVKQSLVNSDYEYGKLLGGGKIFNVDSPVKAGNAYEDLTRKMKPSGTITQVLGDGSGNSKGKFQDLVSRHLQELGIPGIRYLDGGSRGAGEGSYNYVVFDDQIPRIVERNGKGLLQSIK